MKFQILGEQTTIAIDVMNRLYPDCSDFWDGNWVKAKLEMEIPGYRASFHPNLRTDEIRDFCGELKKMQKKLKGRATLSNLDGYLEIECKIDFLGKLSWIVDTFYPAGYGAQLHFTFESDQSYLGPLIKELDDILADFPVIGKP